MVGFREGDENAHFFTGNLVQQLLFEAGDKGTAAQSKGLELSGAAGELDAVAEAGVIQNNLVAVLGGTVIDLLDPGGGLQQTAQLMFGLCLGNGVVVQHSGQTAIFKAHNFLL